MDYVQKHDVIKKSFGGQYYKFFIMFNKNALSQWQKEIENADRKHIISFVQGEFSTSRNIIVKKLT